MKRGDQGFIFLVTLLIISVISLLVLTSMQHILLYYKAINQQEGLHRSFYKLEAVALELGQRNCSMQKYNCVVHEDAPNQMMRNVLEHQGCSFENGALHYQYLIEDLGDFPCLITRFNGKKLATHHTRVSVVHVENGAPVALLQIRLIVSGKPANCLSKERFINLGLSSWRYFPTISTD